MPSKEPALATSSSGQGLSHLLLYKMRPGRRHHPSIQPQSIRPAACLTFPQANGKPLGLSDGLPAEKALCPVTSVTWDPRLCPMCLCGSPSTHALASPPRMSPYHTPTPDKTLPVNHSQGLPRRQKQGTEAIFRTEGPRERPANLILSNRGQKRGQTFTLGESAGMLSARKLGLGKLVQDRASGL